MSDNINKDVLAGVAREINTAGFLPAVDYLPNKKASCHSEQIAVISFNFFNMEIYRNNALDDMRLFRLLPEVSRQENTSKD